MAKNTKNTATVTAPIAQAPLAIESASQVEVTIQATSDAAQAVSVEELKALVQHLKTENAALRLKVERADELQLGGIMLSKSRLKLRFDQVTNEANQAAEIAVAAKLEVEKVNFNGKIVSLLPDSLLNKMATAGLLGDDKKRVKVKTDSIKGISSIIRGVVAIGAR